MKVLFACAGTGGHILPAIVLAQGLKQRDGEMDVLFCLSDDKRGVELLEREHVPWRGVPVSPFPRRLRAASLLFPLSLVRSVGVSMNIIKQFQSDVVVGTGGYVSGPVLLAAWMKGVPAIIQEQNSRPGLANKFLAPLVDEVHVSCPEAARFACASNEKVFITGNPVAGGMNGEGKVTVERRENPGDPPVLLVMGGSQGAHPINRIAVRYLRSLENSPCVIFFQTGKKDYAWVKESLEGRLPQLVIRPFFDDLASIYRKVDLAICRAGAMTLSEVAFWGIPSILIPYPHATGDHQKMNANYFKRQGAAVVLREPEADWHMLKGHVKNILERSDMWKKMSEAALSLRKPDARDILVDRIMALGK